ncbi:NAD(P)/FAD-dependent oxidoreductase, partial [Sulfitobacter sp. HI0023]|uniref:NAD(P)/FAD-dependent oxidoreductase n=3 Tax=Sulfitobacter TaxID=60136 RepID=UPI000AE9FF4D
MKRIYSGFAYSAAPRANCWWDRTCDLPERPTLQGDLTCDVAVIGAGFTGLSAAMHLAKEGVSVAVLEAERVGWGASGRNGGFCCLGGGMLDNAGLEARFGAEGRRDWRATEAASVRFVQDLIRELGIDVDRHSEGETRLAHRPSDFEGMKREAEEIEADYDVTPRLIKAADLPKEGMNAGFHGGLTTPVGFALNPRKYLAGLAKAAEDAGARLFEGTPAHAIHDDRPGFSLDTPQGRVRAGRVIVATNGYSSEDLPDWLRGRYMPTQSSVIVTRPLTQVELDAQGWT